MALEFENKLLIVFCIVSMIFIGIFVFMGLYAKMDYYASTNQIKDYSGTIYNNLTANKLYSSESYILQDFKLDKKSIKYKFCFNSIQSSANALKVNVINENEEVLGSIFVNNITSNNCLFINKSILINSKYIGLNCINCNATQTLTPQNANDGTYHNIIYYNGDYDLLNDYSLIFSITEFKDFRYLTKFFMIVYASMTFLFIFIFMLLSGFEFLYNSGEEMFK